MFQSTFNSSKMINITVARAELELVYPNYSHLVPQHWLQYQQVLRKVPIKDISKYDISKYDISKYDISKYYISKYDISKFDISKYDIKKYDIDQIIWSGPLHR